jgi:hypothetical protein
MVDEGIGEDTKSEVKIAFEEGTDAGGHGRTGLREAGISGTQLGQLRRD